MRPSILAAALLALAAAPAAADATAMCLEGNGMTDAQCACATEALADEIGGGDADLYHAVGTRYLENKAAGQSVGDAWDAAIAETAVEAGLGHTALLTRMNAAGKAHRGAMKRCK